MVGQCAADRLADPPGGVSGELEAAVDLEFLHGADQADVAFLDQVQETHAAVEVLLCDADHEAQVGLDQLLLGAAGAAHLVRVVAVLVVVVLVGPVDLFLRREQGNLANGLQVHLDGVIKAQVVRILDLFLGEEVAVLATSVISVVFRLGGFLDLDAHFQQLVEQQLHLVCGQVLVLGDDLVEFLAGDHAILEDQLMDLVVILTRNNFLRYSSLICQSISSVLQLQV